MRFVDCIDIVGRKPDKYIGVKKYISTGAVGNNNEIIPTEIELYTYEDRPSRANLIAKVGNILFAKMADTKKVLMVDEANSNYLFSTGFFSIAPKKGILTSECLYYLLNSNIFQRQKDKYSSGATQKAITNKGLEKIIVNIPPKEKQETISKELDLAISLINKYKLIITQLDNSIKARFIEMFGNFVYERDRWNVCKIGDVADTIDPQPSHRTPPISSDGIPYVGIAECNYRTCRVDFEKARKVGRNVLREHTERYTLDEGDFIIGKIGTIGKPFFVPVEQTYTLSANTVLIKPIKRKVDPQYLYAVFQSEYMDRIIDAEKKSTSQPAFGIQKVRRIEIPMPPLKLQKQFATFVAQTDKSKVAVQKALDEAQLLFDSLMQKYFG